MAVAFQEDFEAIQNMADDTIYKERHTAVERTDAGESERGGDEPDDCNNGRAGEDGGCGNDDGDDDDDNDDDDDENDGLIDNDRELRKQLKSPLECGFAQTTSKPSVFFKILTEQDVEDRRKARQEKLYRAAVEIAQLEARRNAEEEHRLRRRELEQKERRLRALIMDELRSLWKKGHVFQIPEQVNPYLRGECGSDPEENEIRRRLFHGCFYEFCNGLRSSRKRPMHKRRTILETVTWTAQEIKLYYECMARHQIPIVYGSAAFADPLCSSQRLIAAPHPHCSIERATERNKMHPYAAVHNSSTATSAITAEYQPIPRIGGNKWQTHPDLIPTASAEPSVDSSRPFREPPDRYTKGVHCERSNSVIIRGSDGQYTGTSNTKSNDERPNTKASVTNARDFEFVNELLKENVAVDTFSKTENTGEIDLYDDL